MIDIYSYAIDENRGFFFFAFLYGPERAEIFACKARGTYSRKVAFFRNDSRVYSCHGAGYLFAPISNS